MPVLDLRVRPSWWPGRAATDPQGAASAVSGLRRLGIVDVARGVAVIAMVIFHTAWDLSELRLIEADIRAVPAWSWFARAIAASFLVLVGMGLVLAHGRGLRPRAFLHRLAVIAGAALLVTIGTLITFPDSYIFFGILHCIALASVLALPFLRLPGAVALLAAALCLAAPLVLTQPIFDAPVLAFLGLGTRVPNTNDYVPVFPWFGFVLAGIAAMRFAAPLLARLPERRRAYPAPFRAIAWLGRHSLIIYLLHQPLIFGALSAWAEVVGRSPQAEAAPFMRRCEASCQEGGEGVALCRATCACAIDTFKAEGLWARVVQDRASPEERVRISAVARTCFARSRADGATRPD